jgi:hypothetical protein
MADEPNIAELEARVRASQAAQLEDAIKFVMLGYGDEFGSPFRSPRFRTDELNTEQTQAVVRLIREYREFRGAEVAEALGRFKGQIKGYEFGREGRPVLYINLAPWVHQREGSFPWVKTESRRVSETERDALVNELRSALKGYIEFDYTDEHFKQTLRVYW